MDSKGSKIIPVWMLNSSALIILACTVLTQQSAIAKTTLVVKDSTITKVTPPNKTQAAIVVVADEDDATPLDESIVLAYATKKPDTITPLNEAMVMKYSAQKKAKSANAANGSSTESNKSAHPQIGWNDFGKYVNDNAISPDGKTGMVKLSFVVNANGSLSGFKIDKSLSDAADKAAIDLVKTGPGWTYEANSQSKVVTVNVNFHS